MSSSCCLETSTGPLYPSLCFQPPPLHPSLQTFPPRTQSSLPFPEEDKFLPPHRPSLLRLLAVLVTGTRPLLPGSLTYVSLCNVTLTIIPEVDF